MNQLHAIKASNVRTRWSLREVFKVTQWKSGCVYRTKSLGMISCAPDYEAYLRTLPNIMVCAISTRVSKLIGA